MPSIPLSKFQLFSGTMHIPIENLSLRVVRYLAVIIT